MPVQTVNLQIRLPDNIYNQARESNLLTSKAIEDLLQTEIRKRNVEKLFTLLEQLDSRVQVPLDESDVNAEIEAVRLEKNK